MKARLRVYRQILRQLQLILAGKDFEAALVAAEEAKMYMGRIAELERQAAQPELFNTTEADGEGEALKCAED